MNHTSVFGRIATAFAFLCLCTAARSDVVYVDASGNGHYTSIQPAIDAALDGDVILVRSGTYPGFTIDQRRVFVVADAGAVVKVASKVTIQNTSPSGLVLVAGLEIEGQKGLPGAVQIGLEIQNNAGHVRVHGCTVRGGLGLDTGLSGADGGHASSIVNSSKVVFVGCSLIGGNGGGIPLWVIYGGDGGHGAIEQGSAVAFYDCLLKGGAGGAADYIASYYTAGDGGDGCQAIDYGILASGCQFQGGYGGAEAWNPGNGGDGLFVNSIAQAQLVGNTYAGGFGGWGFQGTFGQDGQPQSGGGLFHNFPGAARKIAAPVLAAENAPLKIDLTGEPGDRAWLVSSALPNFVYMPSYAGMLLVPLPTFMTIRPLVVLPPSGTATVFVPTANVAAGLPVRRQLSQAIVVSASGQVRLSSPLHVVVLNCSDLAPDCNTNGSCDSCDILGAPSIDCDKNGVPDECQPDCNANGVADPCDIIQGTSLDLNHNLIPDECEPTTTTWHVDVNAAPGGNGSAGAPFQTLGQAFSIALPADVVRVADGLYQGPANRNLDFANRDFVVESTGGAANCIIDCQAQGRAFIVKSGETEATRIEGFTIRNGRSFAIDPTGAGLYISSASPVVRLCVFENCEANMAGGGMAVVDSDALIEGCRFIGNKAGTGGGLFFAGYSNPRVLACDFVNNQASEGAAVWARWTTVRFERCLFHSNKATAAGGAIHGDQGAMFLDQCRIAGNTAAYGGAISGGGGGKWHLTNSSLVDNRATNNSGAAYVFNPSASVPSFRNCIFWNNTSPNGTPITVQYGSLDIAWCDLQGGQASVTVGAYGSLIWGPGNIDLDPLFVDRDGPDNDPLTVADNDYRLSLSSPCIDAGENASVAPDWFDLDGDGNVTEPVPLDFDGLPRFIEIPSAPNTGSGTPPLVDFGAWERQP